MTREEITKRIEALSGEMFLLGQACTSKHFDEEGNIRAALRIAGELLKNTSYTLDDIAGELGA